MPEEIIVPFDDTLLQLPSCLAVHAQLRRDLIQLTSEDYVKFIQQSNQLRVCGIISESTVLALAVYRTYLSTFDTVRFEIEDLIVDEKERNRGLGTRLLGNLIDQAKQCGASRILMHCDPTNTDAHRLFFRLGLTIIVFEFDLKNIQMLSGNDRIHVLDITDLPEQENEQLLIRAHPVYLQLRSHLPTDQNAYRNQIRDICRTGSARILLAVNKENEMLGLALYRVAENLKNSKYIYCDDLVTNEHHRSSGVGRCLINYMKNQGEQLGINRLILDSGCQRGQAHRFYYREGFVISQFGFSMTI